MQPWQRLVVVLAILVGSHPARAQHALAEPLSATPTAPAKTFHDPTYKISFDYPANWTFTRRDHEISTFHLDARTAPQSTQLRAVTAVPENPFPASTFSGAYFYLSVIPHSTDAFCSTQAAGGKGSVNPDHPQTAQIGTLSFAHGHDEQKQICTTVRDDIYTVFHRGACFRFDLSANNFCGGQVSGVKDITQKQLDDVFERLRSILQTVRFDSK
jgi:hypothetical protein